MDYIDSYIKNGFSLIPLQPSTKLPLQKDWQNRTYKTAAPWRKSLKTGVGVHLGASGLISLDIDNPAEFNKIIDEFGFDIPPTLKIIGRNPRYIFRSDNKIYKSLSINKKCIFEIRAGNHYDCLPPSIHPQTGAAYQLEGDIDNIAHAPSWLEILAKNWDDFRTQLTHAVTGQNNDIESRIANDSAQASDTVSAKYCASNTLSDALKKYGYKQKSSKRWLSPHSSTGIAGVYIIKNDRAWIHHASDPLCSNSSGKPVNAFDLYVQNEHAGDYKAAYKTLSDNRPRGRPRIIDAPPPVFTRDEPAAPTPAYAATQPQPCPFKFLGYDADNIYILPKIVGSVISIKIASIKKMNLIQIAPLAYWAEQFPAKNGVIWDEAFNFLVENSYSVGLYDPARVRGVGAWFDSGKTVIHCGQSIIENGQRLDVTESTGKYIYEKKIGISDISDKKLSDTESDKVPDLLSKLNFESGYDSKLLAGFAALAPICGALEWRPHCWLSAARGSGKTWIQSNILAPLLGDIALNVQGSTTEAGLRQFLSSDARPILFDEAESENVAAQERMQKIIELARQSSSDSSAVVVKGTVTGSCVKFLPRSMFLMSSINTSLRQSADLSRFTMINLRGKSKDFKEINIEATNLLTDEYCAAFRRRMFDLVPVIRKNAKLLAEKIAEIKNDRRLGDQLGALIAGYIATKTERIISDEESVSLAKDFLLFADKNENLEDADEMQALNFLLQTRVKSSNIDRTLGELVQISSKKRVDEEIDERKADALLARHGVRVERDKLYIANNNAELKKLLNGTVWAHGWRHLLLRIDGAVKGEYPIDFAGSRQRYVSLKIGDL